MKTIACAGVLLAVMAAVLHAQTYVLKESVMGAGGGLTSGTTYVVNGTLGQSSPVGMSSGTSYQTHHGFWHAVGWAPLDAMVLSIQLVSSSTARLLWDPVTAAAVYDLYRSTSPYFTASGAVWQSVSAPVTEYDFTAGIGDPSVTYYFKGKARNAVQSSPESNTVGEFERSSTASAATRTRAETVSPR